jgi:hypothetical protein
MGVIVIKRTAHPCATSIALESVARRREDHSRFCFTSAADLERCVDGWNRRPRRPNFPRAFKHHRCSRAAQEVSSRFCLLLHYCSVYCSRLLFTALIFNLWLNCLNLSVGQCPPLPSSSEHISTVLQEIQSLLSFQLLLAAQHLCPFLSLYYT